MQLEGLIELNTCPDGEATAVRALWYDKRGDWNTAHELVQNASDRDSAWVHAYLHRKEGDLANAGYWYRRSGRSSFNGELDREWEAIARELLS